MSLDQIRDEASDLLRQRYAALLHDNEMLRVAARMDPSEVEVTVCIETSGGDERVEIDTKVSVPLAAEKPEEALLLALDAADAFLGEWLEGGREERHSIDYVEHRYEGRFVLVRLRRSRPLLEAQADRLLQQARDLGPEES